MIRLVTGGARSGKSRFAQELALREQRLTGRKVLYIATAEVGDLEMQARIAAHRLSRPADWETLEAPRDLFARLEELARHPQPPIVLVDCLTLYWSNRMLEAWETEDEQRLLVNQDKWERVLQELAAEILSLAENVTDTCRWILVTNEVGWGVVPPAPLGRLYRDWVGKGNQMLAQWADEVYLVVSGIPVAIKGGGDRS